MVKRLGLTAAVFLVLSSCGPSQDERLTSLEAKVRNLAELHTFEQTYRDVVYLGEQREFLFFRTMDRQLLFSVNIRVRAGVDLRQGVRVLPGADRRSVFVEVPAPSILLVDADEESISQYFVRERGGAIGWLEVGAEIEAAKAQVTADAVNRGILDRAGENAREVLENLFSQAGFESVTITFGDPDPQDLEG